MNSGNRRISPLSFPGYFSIALMILLALSVPANAQEYRSGWDLINSGTLHDLYSVESEENEVWAFGENGTMVLSGDGGLSWEVGESLTSSDLTISDSGFGSFLAASMDGTILIKSGNEMTWSDISLDIGDESIYGACLTGGNEACLLYTSPSPRDQ